MKKFDWNHSITRKDYAILCALAFILYLAGYYVICWISVYFDDVKNWVKTKIKKFKTKRP